jgi:hypothetical protein
MLEEVEMINVHEKQKNYPSSRNQNTEELEKTKKKVQELFKE